MPSCDSVNSLLQNRESIVDDTRPQFGMFNTPLKQQSELENMFDDFSEPPPELRSYEAQWAASPAGSTCVGSSFGFGSGTVTPLSDSRIASGYATPVPASVEQVGPAVGQICNGVALVPVWFSMGDRLQIPCGVVQQARAIFERHASIPSFFNKNM